MKRVFLYLFGFFLSVIGLFFCFLNLNLFTIGYSFRKYVKFIISNIECSVFLLGIIVIILAYERK